MNCFDYTINALRRLLCQMLLMIMLSVGAVSATAAPSFGYVLRVDRSAMAVVDGSVVVSLQLTALQDVPAMQSVVLVPELVDTLSQRNQELPMIFINSRNQQIYYERNLRQANPDAIALRKKNGVDLNIDYVRTVRYEPWMANAVLRLRERSCACSDAVDRGAMVVAAFDREEAPVEIQLFPVYLVPPADNSVKVREESGSAYLCFEVNKWDIKPDYMTNPAELQKIHNSVNLVRNDSDVTIRKMTIEGFASPEGPNDRNIMLSENRTEALKRYLGMTNIARGINIEATGKGENWQGFIKRLREETTVPQHSRLMDIALSNREADEKERLMRKEAPEGFQYVVKNWFPSLRCTNYTVVYTVRPFTIEESERVFETRPINLNLNEIYKLAEKYASDREKYYSIIRKAYTLYPNDTYINLTMACLALKRGDADEAAQHLTKVDDCGEKCLNEGIVAYMRGDLDAAIRLVERAKQMGVKQASDQLEEFAKIKK